MKSKSNKNIRSISQVNKNQYKFILYFRNGEDLAWLESESFDLISYAYVLHEMPEENAMRVLNEMYRLLRPGGTMNGFEVPYPDTELGRIIMTEFNTWGHKWEEEGPKVKQNNSNLLLAI